MEIARYYLWILFRRNLGNRQVGNVSAISPARFIYFRKFRFTLWCLYAFFLIGCNLMKLVSAGKRHVFRIKLSSHYSASYVKRGSCSSVVIRVSRWNVINTSFWWRIGIFNKSLYLFDKTSPWLQQSIPQMSSHRNEDISDISKEDILLLSKNEDTPSFRMIRHASPDYNKTSLIETELIPEHKQHGKPPRLRRNSTSAHFHFRKHP